MKYSAGIAALLLVVGLTSGCATITSTEMQPVTVTTHSAEGQPVEQVACSLKNDVGSWSVTSPGVVSVKRSAEDLMVECKKEGSSNGFARAVSRAAGGMWGNILFGGGIGAIIDHNKGVGYDYPNDMIVKMGQSVTIDRKDEKRAAEAKAEKENPGPKN
ncbi:MAG: hypothetical protein HY082_08085 [Gammaproteobacteria bacterium]|nr:hypothetical protein [Gammaproteobacteria bacterium]